MSHAGQTPPYDRGWAWLIVVGVFINCFIMMGTMKSYGLILEALLDKFDVSVALASSAVSVTGIVYALASPLMLMLSEQFTIQRVVIFGSVLGFVGLSFTSFLCSIEYFIVIFGLSTGICYACIYANGLVIISFYFRRRLSLATGLGLTGASVGQFLMPQIIEFLMRNYGFHGTLAVIGGLHLNAAVAGMLFRPITSYKQDTQGNGTGAKELTGSKNDIAMPDTNKNTKQENMNETEGLFMESEMQLVADVDLDLASEPDIYNETGSQFLKPPTTEYDSDVEDAEKVLDLKEKELKQITSSSLQIATLITEAPPKKTRRKIFDCSAVYSHITQFYVLATFLFFFGYFNFTLFLPPIITSKGIQAYDKALLYSFCGIGDLIARLITGFIADFKLIERYKIQIITGIFCGLNIFIMMYTDAFAAMAVNITAFGVFGGAFISLTPVVLFDFVGRPLVAKNFGVMLPVHGVGAALGQIILGSIRDVTGSYDLVIVIVSACVLCGGAMLVFYPTIRRLEDKRVGDTQETTHKDVK